MVHELVHSYLIEWDLIVPDCTCKWVKTQVEWPFMQPEANTLRALTPSNMLPVVLIGSLPTKIF